MLAFLHRYNQVKEALAPLVTQPTPTPEPSHMIESIMSIFAVGAFGFWFLIAAFTIVLFFSCELQAFGWASVFGTIMLLFYGKELFAVATLKMAIIYVVGYLIIGSIWSILWWYLWVRLKLQEAERGRDVSESDLSVNYNKAAITGSIIFWPWSMIWFSINSSLKRIYHSLWGYYSSIAERGKNRLKVINDAKKAETVAGRRG